MPFDESKHFEEIAIRWWRLGNHCDTFLSWTTVSAWFVGAAMMSHDESVDHDAWFLSRLASIRAGVHKT